MTVCNIPRQYHGERSFVPFIGPRRLEQFAPHLTVDMSYSAFKSQSVLSSLS